MKERQEAGQSKSADGEGGEEGGANSTEEPWYPSETLGQFGLLGLLRVIRMTEADLNMLALGVDLTKLGLNLNSPDYLSQSFGSPWSDTPMREQDPEYWLPSSYYVHPTSIKNAHLGRFTVDTVFYLFHNVPGDLLQTYAATELCLRGWRYHVDLQLWFRTVPEETTRPAGDAARQPQWIYFDPQQWQKCFYRKSVDQKRFLPVEDCQVKKAPPEKAPPATPVPP
jgi:CCR4-NOT transcription complex subunit 2